MLFIGIDPGIHGAMAAVNEFGRPVSAVPMPERDDDLWAALERLLNEPAGQGRGQVQAVLEKAQASPRMGTVSAFTYGVGYGRLRMALAAARVPFEDVVARRWQLVLGCQAGGTTDMGRGGDKNVTKRRAAELFPELKVTHNIADALLMAEYCRRLHVVNPLQARSR